MAAPAFMRKLRSPNEPKNFKLPVENFQPAA